jgi:hypothetical protein
MRRSQRYKGKEESRKEKSNNYYDSWRSHDGDGDRIVLYRISKSIEGAQTGQNDFSALQLPLAHAGSHSNINKYASQYGGLLLQNMESVVEAEEGVEVGMKVARYFQSLELG